MFKFVKLNNGKIVPCVFESQQSEIPEAPNTDFYFKKLNDGTFAQVINFVDWNGNIVKCN
jgi:hypothetical protein